VTERASGVVRRFPRRDHARQGCIDTTPEACADLRVGDTGGDLLDRKGEAHIGTRFGRWEREPTIQIQDILVPVPIALGDIVTPATHLLNTSLASCEKLFSLG